MTTPRKLPAGIGALLLKAVVGVLAAWFLLAPAPSLHDPARGLPSSLFSRGLHAAGSTPDAASRDDQGAVSRELILERLGVTAWHRAGYLGKGLKVAVLDSGFAGYRAHLGRDLPKHVLARSFRLDGNLEAKDSQHGILCGEVIHALAPEAELLFANWEADRAEQFLAAVRWAKEQGARVISCSVITPTWSDGEGHGPVHARLAQILGDGGGPDDVLLFASAGNTAQRHWGGVFRDAGDGAHEWTRGVRWNHVKPWSSERVSIELCAQPGGDYELVVEDATTDRAVGRGETAQATGRGCAAVRFLPQPGHEYRLLVRLVRGAASRFHLVVLGGSLQHATSQGSVPFPGDGAEVIAVGAVDHDGRRWAYSSCGPNAAAPKPDLSAAVPFPSAWRARPFSGTSAAAPQAAALAALLWSRHPGYSARRVRATLREDAERSGAGRHDDETGYGRIHLP